MGRRLWAGAPAAPPRNADHDRLPIRPAFVVLVVAAGEQGHHAVVLVGAGLDDSREAIRPRPPELRPVILIVVGENADAWIGCDVGQAPQARGALGLVVHSTDDRITVDRERDRHQMRLTLRVDCGQPCHAGRRNERPGLGSVHYEPAARYSWITPVRWSSRASASGPGTGGTKST